MKIKIAALVVALALSGCGGYMTKVATTDLYMGTKAMNEGDYKLAEKKLLEAIHEGNLATSVQYGLAWNNLGVVYLRTQRKDLATAAFTMAARYGEPSAAKNLALVGRSVPRADLVNAPAVQQAQPEARAAQTQAASNDNNFLLQLLGAVLGGAAQGYAEGSAAAPSRTTVINNYAAPKPVNVSPPPKAYVPLQVPRTVNCRSIVVADTVRTTCD